MIRFILKRKFKIYDFEQETFETIDIDLPELEIKFFRGGHGEQGHDITSLVGIELIEEQKQPHEAKFLDDLTDSEAESLDY